MKKADIQDWGKYKKQIDKENKLLVKSWWQEVSRQQKERDQRDKKRKAERERLTKKYYADVRKYDKLPFWKRWGQARPEIPLRLGVVGCSLPLLWETPPFKHATYEGFLDWKLSQMKQIKA